MTNIEDELKRFYAENTPPIGGTSVAERQQRANR